MESVPQSPANSEHSETDLKQMYMHKIISAPDSAFTLEHRRQTPEEKKLIYSVRFDPDDNKCLAVGTSIIYHSLHNRLLRWIHWHI